MQLLIVTLITISIVLAIYTFHFWNRCRQAGWTFDSLQKAVQTLETTRRHRQELEDEITEKLKECQALCSEQSIALIKVDEAKKQLESARALASKELELQNERLKQEYAAKLDAELEQLTNEHPVTKAKEILEGLENQIAEAKKILVAHHAEVQAAANEEDFNAANSISLSVIDQQDISLLREFALRMGRQDAINKLIWTEWYQRPLQALRKALKADKVTGIYMIKEIGTGRMYIGQATNIGERWAEHVKIALGIGSTANKTNKFYVAMHNKGPENFTFQILQECPTNELNERECYWIDFYDAVSFGFNTKIGG